VHAGDSADGMYVLLSGHVAHVAPHATPQQQLARSPQGFSRNASAFSKANFGREMSIARVQRWTFLTPHHPTTLPIPVRPPCAHPPLRRARGGVGLLRRPLAPPRPPPPLFPVLTGQVSSLPSY